MKYASICKTDAIFGFSIPKLPYSLVFKPAAPPGPCPRANAHA